MSKNQKLYQCSNCNKNFYGKRFKNLCLECYNDNYKKKCIVCNTVYYLDKYNHKYKFINGKYVILNEEIRQIKCGLCAVNDRYIENCSCCRKEFITNPYGNKRCNECKIFFEPQYNYYNLPINDRISKNYVLEVEFVIIDYDHKKDCPFLEYISQDNKIENNIEKCNKINDDLILYFPVLEERLGLYYTGHNLKNIIKNEYNFEKPKCLYCKPTEYIAKKIRLINI